MRLHTVLALGACILVGATVTAAAEYRVAGKFKATFCSGWVIKRCVTKQVDAVETVNAEARARGAQMDALPESFASVDEFREDHPGFGRCSVKVYDWGAPVFYQYVAGPRHLKTSYKELGSPEAVSFRCAKE